MPQEVIERLPALPLEKMRILAGVGMLCFSSRLSEKFWRELLHTEMDTEMDEDLLRARVLLMIAGGEGGPYGDDDGTA